MRLSNLVRRFLADERAAEITELGIVLAIVVAGCVATIALIGPKVKKAYVDMNTVIP